MKSNFVYPRINRSPLDLLLPSHERNVLTSIHHLFLLTLQGKETHSPGHKLIQNKIQKKKKKKKDPEKVPTLLAKVYVIIIIIIINGT